MSTAVHGDSWRGARNDEWHLDHPTWREVDGAIRRLDARRHTLVTIQGPGEQHLTIGGGAGRYVVYATFDNLEFWNLLGAAPEGTTVMLNAGGQEGDYPARQVVELEQALAAAEAFFAGLRLRPSLRWERQ